MSHNAYEISLRPVADRLLDNSEPQPNGCRLWTGTMHTQGYGQISVGNRQRTAHRLSYETFIGPIPEGLLVCHRCDVRRCIAPEHLYAGTHLDNSRDAVERGRLIRPTCGDGHEWTPDNIIVDPGDGKRRCRTCRRAAGRRFKQRQREQRLAAMTPAERAVWLGEACAEGHPHVRGEGRCGECARISARERYWANPERHRDASRLRQQAYRSAS